MKCSKGVFGAGQACQAMGNLYHDACFTCAACSKYGNRCGCVWEGADAQGAVRVGVSHLCDKACQDEVFCHQVPRIATTPVET